MANIREELQNFYKGTDYNELRKEVFRPHQWHLPEYLARSFNNKENQLKSFQDGRKITIPLDLKDMKLLRGTLLHESLFSYYKSFYNYLVSKNMYSSGAVHWNNVTVYYAKLYLAGAINNLLGNRSYVVSIQDNFFDKNIYNILKPNKYLNESAAYTINLKMDVTRKKGSIVFNTDRMNSHTDIWKNYKNIDFQNLGLSKLTSEHMHDNDYMHLSKERNRENYTFKGYSQIDFNLSQDNFESYFKRDDLKKEKQLVYDSEVGIIIGVISQLYHLYNSFSIQMLPIEISKFKYMVNYMVDDQILKSKLLNLIEAEFPINNGYIEEMHKYYKEK